MMTVVGVSLGDVVAFGFLSVVVGITLWRFGTRHRRVREQPAEPPEQRSADLQPAAEPKPVAAR